jgi:hypothetical protein
MNLYKKIVLCVCLMVLSLNVMAAARVEFSTIKHDFGTINEADGKVSCSFELKNVGDAPLVILGVYVTCGCTTYEYTQEPIAPGELGEVRVTLDPTGLEGSYIKSIHIYTNTRPKKKTVRIHSYIVPQED